MDDLRIRLLTPIMQVLDEKGRVVDLGRKNNLKRLVSELAVQVPNPVSPSRLRSALGSRDMVYQQVKALKQCTGLRTDGGGMTAGYALKLPSSAIDVHRVLTEAERNELDATAESVAAALNLVHPDGPCPELTQFHASVRDRLEAGIVELRRRLRRLETKRVLIVEDQIGTELADQLAPYKCTVVANYAAFRELSNVMDFDLALVDLHLSNDIADLSGEAVIRTLRARKVQYPIVLMTANPWTDHDITAYGNKHGVSVITKGPPGSGRVGAVIDKVQLLVSRDLQGSLLDRLRSQLVEVRAEAYDALAIRGRIAEVERMTRDWAQLWLVFDREDVGGLRAEIDEFRRRWT